jgi:hypothetical protein
MGAAAACDAGCRVAMLRAANSGTMARISKRM